MVSSRSIRGKVFYLYFPDEKLGGELLGGGYGSGELLVYFYFIFLYMIQERGLIIVYREWLLYWGKEMMGV